MNSDTGSILIVEDDTGLAARLQAGLTEAGYGVRLAISITEARRQLAEGNIDLLLLDLGLPDGDGMALMSELHQSGSGPATIITTARAAINSRVEGLTSGADDYLTKPYDFGELLARIRIQLRHAQRVNVREQLDDLIIDRVARTVLRGGDPIDLTPKEFDLLLYLLTLKGSVASRDMLARDVWHVRSRMTSMDNIIDVHISRLRTKIDRGRANPLLQTVRGVGFTLQRLP